MTIKRLIVLALFLTLVATVGFTSRDKIQAENNTENYANRSQQVQNHFMVSLFQEEIQKAVSNYYESEVGTSSKDAIQIMYHWWEENYKVVEVLQTEKGQNLENSYVIKFTIVPQRKEQLGTDTITFGVEPKSAQNELEVKMLKYEHKAP
ncbi:DUF3888 domain-containing protein [Jeotgalibacillus haloalkalitolerans]|uniref:DUF3888 domain-containing protein n=1 Tax=Jeotgalibacillus haloalkalitolerans TaxID=3104292 RepID=A0ABU5KRF0_9BACL|nr:DUF3888 domain-containing protein [Jeotgalibacillus sp. HH7-29]MDZ5713826.1 DUF3888 domain-containing protein [Jeotgalibacillus sp. HH7-29]